MGLAASQVRLLQLTARMHNIEYQAQRIQAQKLQLSNESDQVYKNYMNALDAKKLQFKYVDDMGIVNYNDANFKELFTYAGSAQAQYALEIIYDPDSSKVGKYYVDADVAAAWGSSTGPSKTDFLKSMGALDSSGAIKDVNKNDYYSKLYDILEGKQVVSIGSYGSNEWLTNVLSNGQVLIHKYCPDEGENGLGAWIESSVTTDTLLQEINNEKDLKVAEATYEAETKKINRKDARYDTELSETETERTAIKTEIDSLKTTRNDNVNMAFKLFS